MALFRPCKRKKQGRGEKGCSSPALSGLNKDIGQNLAKNCVKFVKSIVFRQKFAKNSMMLQIIKGFIAKFDTMQT
jgi:hypothetical protein